MNRRLACYCRKGDRWIVTFGDGYQMEFETESQAMLACWSENKYANPMDGE